MDLKITGGAETGIAGFAQQHQAHANHQPQNAGHRQDQRFLGRGRTGWHHRIGQDATVGFLDALLGRGLFQPGQEIFVQQPNRLGFTCQLLQGDQFLPPAGDLRFHFLR